MDALTVELDEPLEEETTAAEREWLRRQKNAVANEKGRKALMGLS